MTLNPCRRALRRLITLPLLLAMIIIGGVAVLVQPRAAVEQAAAETTSSHGRSLGTHGAGLTLRGQWFGTWKVSDGIGFCIEFDKGHPDSLGARQLGNGAVPGMSAEDTRRVTYVVNTYARTRSDRDAAAAAIYVWQTQHTRRFDTYYRTMVKARAIPATVRAAVARIAVEAKNHGPYRLGVTLGAGYVGQTVAGTTTVRAANGAPVAGMRVSIASTANGTLVRRAATTDRTGHLRFTVRVTTPGAVRVEARIAPAKPGGVWVTRPTPARQKLVLAGSATHQVKASATSQKNLGRPTLTSSCDSDCRGVAPVTVTVVNPSGSTVREFIRSNGTTVPGGTFDVPAGRTVRKTIRLADASVVTTSYCFLDAQRRCTGAQIANPGSLTVVCPPLVEFHYAGTCPCDGVKTISYELRAPAGSQRSFVAVLTTGGTAGARTTRVTLTNGTWQSLGPVSLPRGASVELSVTVLGKTRVLDAFSQTS